MIYNENEQYINAISVISFNIATKVNAPSEIYYPENPPIGIQYKDNLKYNFHAQDFYKTNNIDKNHVYDIKSTNMLGRKELSYLSAEIDSKISSEFSLLHEDENFKYSPYKLRINSNFANVNWNIIEYTNNENNVSNTNITTQELNTPNENNLKLAKPKYFKNNIKSTTIYTPPNNLYKYFIFELNDVFQIKYLDNIDINNILFYGPFNTLKDCEEFILQFAETNGLSINKINQYYYKYEIK